MESSSELNDNLSKEKLFFALKKSELITKILFFTIFILVSFLVGYLTILFISDYGISAQSTKPKRNDDNKLVIVSRAEWLVQLPKHPAGLLNLPVPNVIILHTATENCTNPAKCALITRNIQTYNMKSKGLWDIGYNFLVGGDGNVYEGRGWKGQGAHVYGWNSKSISIAFIGAFHEILPPDEQILAAKMLIEKGVEDGYIAEDYKLFAHRQLSKTLSPGQALFENMKTWPHWSKIRVEYYNAKENRK